MKKKECSNESECVHGQEHEFVVLIKPEGNRSGWHVDVCRICGKKISYDTSD